ncbi:hypothetical protein, partial [Rothia nasisuis]|uniref:hypothetical protein n=1 Tax=Rothia nasisuis TaxID=2109647 RepID=UPI001F20477C
MTIAEFASLTASYSPALMSPRAVTRWLIRFESGRGLSLHPKTGRTGDHSGVRFAHRVLFASSYVTARGDP